MITLSLIFFGFAAACHGVLSLIQFGQFKFSKEPFWNKDSWKNKYNSLMTLPKDNWYYKFFKIDYRERFPLSATMFVFVTDGFHLTQWLMIKCLCAGIACLVPHSFIVFFACWIIWTVCFQIAFIGLKK